MWLLYSWECNFIGSIKMYDSIVTGSLWLSAPTALYLLSIELKLMLLIQPCNEVSLMKSKSLFKNSTVSSL